MKFAPWVAGAALGTIVVALSTANAIDAPEKTTLLDVSGIDTLEVASNRSIDIEIDSGKPARAKYDDSTKSRLRVHREGNRLVVDSELDGYVEFQLSVPASVHRFVLDGGKVHTKETLPEVEFLAKGDVTWNGNAGRLVMRDIKDRKKGPCKCNYVLDFSVAGTIGDAWFYSPNGQLHLSAPDEVGQVHAWLGPKGNVSLENARRFDHIHLVDSEDAMPPPGVSVAAP